MSVQIIMDRDVYLDSPVTPVTLTNAIYAGDSDAQRIRFRCFQKHGQIAPMDLSEITITAHFIRPDGGDVVITGVGGTTYSYVDLPEACYVYPGIFKLLIRASTANPDVVTSILYVTGRIDKPTTDVIIDPGTTIPSLEDLLAQIDACEDAADAANAAAANAEEAVSYISATYSEGGTYAVGDYVIEDEKLYRCITANNGGQFDSSKWEEVSVGGELDRLADDFAENGIATEPITLTKTGKYYNTSGDTIDPAVTSSSTNFSCDVVDCAEGDVFTISGTGTSENSLPWAIIDSNNNVLTKASNTSSKYEIVIAPANAAKLILNNRISSTPDAVSYYGYNVTNAMLGIMNAYKYRGAIPDGTDLDTLYETGWYIIGANSLCTNSPEADTAVGQRLVCIYPASNTPGSNTYRIMTYFNNETRVSSYRFYFSSSWHSWTLDFRYIYGEAPNGTDLNDLVKSGWYILGATNTHPNCPEGNTTTGQRIIIVYTSTQTVTTSTYRVMLYLNNYTGFSAFRYYFSGSWHRWINFGFSALSVLSGEVDLNDLYATGWQYIAYSATCTNSPEPDGTIGQRYVFICPNSNDGSNTTARMMQYFNMRTGVYAVRLFVSGKWEQWTILSSADANTRLETITPAAQASQGENAGDNLRIVSYNVARYNNNSSTYLSDQKIFNFRRALGKFNGDILCIQEDMQYIDSGSTKESNGYLYLPQYPYTYNGGIWKNTIHSKRPATANGRVKLTAQGNDYRSIEFATYTIGQKVLLVCSSHPSWNDSGEGGDSAAQIAIRLSNYTEIFQWVDREITLPDSSTAAAVMAPEHTHCIICMDANSFTPDDKTNLSTLAAQHDFILGNGGALGWFYTCQSNTPTLSSLDNVIVSDNIIINSIEAYMELWRSLYSDHVPVVADVTLL